MKSITLNKMKLIQVLKILPVIRIAIMLIVAVLSFKYSGVESSALALFFTTMLFALQIVFVCKHNNDNVSSNISFYSYVPAILVMLAFTTFNLLTKRELLYSLTISLSLSLILLPRNKSYYDIFSFIVNKKKYLYSCELHSCKDILKCNKFVLNAKNLFTESKLLCSVSTAYSHYDFDKNVFDIKNDYAVEILKEFSSVLNINVKNFTFVENNEHAKYDYYQQPKNINGLSYAVLNNKDGYRLIVCGDFALISDKCSSYADKNMLSDLFEDKSKLIESISLCNDDHSQLLSFAFCDLDEFEDIDTIDNMTYIGTLGVKNELRCIADSLINDICTYNYPTKIKCNKDNLKFVVDLINSYNLNYTVLNTDIFISDFAFDETDAVHLNDNKIIYNDNTYSNKDTPILFGELKENAKRIIDYAVAMENKINVLSYSIIITFLLATTLIPNNVMQPCVIVMILSIVEIISLFAVDTYKTSIKALIINTFVIAFSALSVFFAGRFLVDVQVSKFDKESVEIARTMLIYFYIVLAAFYDSLTVFSEPKKHINNIIIMFICISLIYILNLLAISGLILFKHLNFEAIKYIILFTVIPVLINIILATVNNRKVTKNGQ